LVKRGRARQKIKERKGAAAVKVVVAEKLRAEGDERKRRSIIPKI
jgi:hypothetical protein